ncbi:hypothetical protein G9A89_001785 [Geosiphon pyriformis]|nr:hypothetical protein G9A89_001785 [Geosiphon pyriformis]
MYIRRPRGKLYEWFSEMHRQFGSVVRIGPNWVIFADKEAIRQIMVTDSLPKIDGIKAIQTHENIPTLFTSTDPSFHKKRRKLLSPGFSIKYLATLEPLMKLCTRALIKKIHSIVSTTDPTNDLKSPAVNILHLVQACSLDIIGETAFGGSFNIIETGDYFIPQKVFKDLKRRIMRTTFPLLKPFLQQDLWSFNLMNKIIKERRVMNANGQRREDILQILLDTRDEETGKGLSDFEIYDQTIEFLIAGSDTTAFTINIALITLLYNPVCLRKLITEIDSALGNERDLPSHDSLKNLPYLNAVINETMRLSPIAMHGFWRQPREDIVINGTFVPKNTTIVANINALHHSKEVWGPDAENFVPERWLDENVPKRDFYPFGASTRICIAVNFAMMELRTVLVALLREFEFEMIPGQITSWFIKPKTLLVIRFFFTIYALIALIAVVLRFIGEGNPLMLNYFTYLSYIGLFTYFGLSVFYSYRFIKNGTVNAPKFLNYFFWTLYHTLCHYHLIVPVVYWTFLSNELIKGNKPAIEWWRQLSVHAFDALMMFTEIFMNRQSFVWPFLCITLVFQVLFMFEAFLTHATRNLWVYNFLSWDKGPIAALWYIGLFVFFTIIFSFQVGIHAIRDIIGRWVGHAHNNDDDDYDDGYEKDEEIGQAV